MGIPSYFAYLLKNHRNIFKNLNNIKQINNLYIDANGIIYNNIKNTLDYFESNKDINFNIDNFEEKLIDGVIAYLNKLIKKIKPTNNVIIAFDGAPPLAKIYQQRTRRFKNSYLNHLFKKEFSWDTCSISPGTNFMKKLDNSIEKQFNNQTWKLFNTNKIILCPSYELGEGEHKIFSYIRKNIKQHDNHNTVIYGLDADLIMLSLNHLTYCKNIYLYRDGGEQVNNQENNFFCINDLAIELINVITNPETNTDKNCSLDSEINRNIIKDYIFMCFLLGNDFLPHFPALNIRLNGIDTLINVYSEYFYKESKNLVFYDKTNVNYKINMKNFKEFVRILSEHEEQFLINLEISRQRQENNFLRNNIIDLKNETILNNLPIFDRNIEKFINPSEIKWEKRYYISLLNIDLKSEEQEFKETVSNIANNYIKTLLWTLNYYNDDCIDWRLAYNYNYPPLLIDLYKYIPYFDNEITVNKELNPYPTLCSLVFIIPPNSYNLLPCKIKSHFDEKYNVKDYNILDMKFYYAYCKFFWEAHIQDEITEKQDINLIEKDILNLL